jgi:hypothetical protein
MTDDSMMDGWDAEMRDRSTTEIAGKISSRNGLN